MPDPGNRSINLGDIYNSHFVLAMVREVEVYTLNMMPMGTLRMPIFLSTVMVHISLGMLTPILVKSQGYMAPCTNQIGLGNILKVAS